MLSSDKTQTTAFAASLVDWWEMAGVDYLVEDIPVDWLAAKIPEVASKIATPPSEMRVAPTEPMVKRAAISAADWPMDIAELQSAIMAGQPLPGNQYGGKSASHLGNANARLMIIGDLPDIQEIEARSLGVGAAGQLLEKMVGAIGLAMADCYLTALATTRPATGELPDEDLDSLAAFALHQINLVNPKAILLLGSATRRALLGADLAQEQGSLRDVNHIVGKKAAIPTSHPRTLLTKPNLKAQAWKDLQMLAKKDAL